MLDSSLFQLFLLFITCFEIHIECTHACCVPAVDVDDLDLDLPGDDEEDEGEAKQQVDIVCALCV